MENRAHIPRYDWLAFRVPMRSGNFTALHARTNKPCRGPERLIVGRACYNAYLRKIMRATISGLKPRAITLGAERWYAASSVTRAWKRFTLGEFSDGCQHSSVVGSNVVWPSNRSSYPFGEFDRETLWGLKRERWLDLGNERSYVRIYFIAFSFGINVERSDGEFQTFACFA